MTTFDFAVWAPLPESVELWIRPVGSAGPGDESRVADSDEEAKLLSTSIQQAFVDSAATIRSRLIVTPSRMRSPV